MTQPASLCSRGQPGTNGIPGMHGMPGSPGAPGRDGCDGVKGDQGSPGKTGPEGPPSAEGKKGAKGEPGVQGPDGRKGERGEKLKNCEFTKNFTDTALHVYFAGNLRIHGCDHCCSRWYFTFNGTECSSPGPIEGVFYMAQGKSSNIHRHRHIEGHCNKIAANARISLSTVLNVHLPCQLTVLCTCGKETLKIFTVSAILRGTVTTSLKERCV
ncbi:hypothetical protein ACROYT_G012964 [Oculina patagonica]